MSGTFEAKNKLSSLVESASKGSRIWVAKRDRRVALLSSIRGSGVPPAEGVEKTPQAGGDSIATFRTIRLRTKVAKGVTLKSLVEEGRR